MKRRVTLRWEGPEGVVEKEQKLYGDNRVVWSAVEKAFGASNVELWDDDAWITPGLYPFDHPTMPGMTLDTFEPGATLKVKAHKAVTQGWSGLAAAGGGGVLGLGAASARSAGAAALEQGLACLRPQTSVLRIKFSLFNIKHVRMELWRNMHEGGMFGKVQRTSETEVQCDIVAFNNDAGMMAFGGLLIWLSRQGRVVDASERDVKLDGPTVRISGSRMDDFVTSDQEALAMLGTKKVFAATPQMEGSISTDPLDSTHDNTSLPSADPSETYGSTQLRAC